MGCCVSTTSADLNDKNAVGHTADSDNNKPPRQAPAVVEEETVKEVLSETTLPTSSNNEPVIENKTQKPIKEKIREDDEKLEILEPDRAQGLTRPDNEDASEVSDILSLSMSESVASTVVNLYEDRDEEVKQRKLQGTRQKSPAKPRNRVTGHIHNPSRRSDQSPAKRNVGETGSVRLVHPSPRRRSSSPATNRSVMSPGLATGREWKRKKSESPSRVRLDPGKNGSEQLNQWSSCGGAAGNYNGAPRESLENPLVSLECFIFL